MEKSVLLQLGRAYADHWIQPCFDNILFVLLLDDDNMLCTVTYRFAARTSSCVFHIGAEVVLLAVETHCTIELWGAG